MPRQQPRGNIVYSTDPDPLPPPTDDAPPPPTQQTARLIRDRKRRAGKTVTVIAGLHPHAATLETLLTTLKKQLGTGGALKDGELEIQGDHRDTIAALLTKMGYKVKLVGG